MKELINYFASLPKEEKVEEAVACALILATFALAYITIAIFH